jgi:beta-lactamase regulating signal transducer with metallopeptidase domain
MNAFYDIMTLDIWQSVLWVLVHSLWQGIAIALVLYFLLKWIPVRQAQWRYWLAFIGLVMVVVGGLTTWSIQRLPEAPAAQAAVQEASAVNAKYLLTPAMISELAQDASAPSPTGPGRIWAASVVAFWAIGVLAMLLRVAFSLGTAQGLVQGGRVLEDPGLMHCIASLQKRLRLGAGLTVKVVDALDVPAVIGLLRPTLLLPLAFLNEMPLHQVEVVLAHELAHIRRHDVLFALLQRMIEALLFFNPAVWWISRQVSLEREACCDAWAAQLVGPPETVAQTLFDVVKRLHQPAPAPSVAVALAKGKRPGHFTERLRRLVDPTARARLRLPWASFMLLLAMTGLGLTVLHWGTNRAVIKAAELLSPKQHIERIAQAKEDYEPPEHPMIMGTARDILVRGTVRTFDGSPLPDDLRIHLMGQQQGGIAFYDAKLEGSVFQYKISERRVSVIAVGERFAPMLVGPLEIESGQILDNIEMVLQAGFPAQIKLHDPTGQPIEEVQVEFSYHYGNTTLGSDTLTSDEMGLVSFKHAANLPISLSIRTRGYQYDYLKTRLNRDKVLDWTLIPTQATTGILISKKTGQPITHAPIYLLSRQGFHNRVFDARKSYIQKDCRLTETDAQGRFVLNSLREDCIYALYIDGTDDYGPDILSGIVAGQPDLRLQVSPPRYIQGRILGDYEPERGHLDGQRDVPVLSFSNSLRFGNTSFCSGVQTRLHKLDDQAGWSFKIPNLLPNDVDISLKAHSGRKIPKITQAIEHYVIDLRPGAPDPSVIKQETRTVVVKLHAPQGWPVPTGKIRLDYVMTDRNAYKPHWLDLKNGQVQLDVPMLPHGQGKFLYRSTKDLIGYWIEEKSEIPIPSGDEPYVIDVQAHPAGAVHGAVLDWDGKLVDNASVYMDTVQKSPDTLNKRLPLDHSVSVGPDGRFVFTPVPLEGTYQLKAYRSHDNECSLVFSQELTVTRETPTRIVTLTLPAGKTIRGRVVTPDGQGLAHTKVSLNYKYEHGSHWGLPITSDAEGCFEFVNVNTEADCHYSYRVSSIGNYGGCDVAASLQGTQKVVLEEGLILRGRVIDIKSKGLIPGAELSLYAHDSAARNKGSIKTQTNARGEFVIRGLEAIEYGARVEGAVPPDTKIRENADGTISYQGGKSFIVNGKQADPVDIYVQLKPRSRLRPLEGTP